MGSGMTNGVSVEFGLPTIPYSIRRVGPSSGLRPPSPIRWEKENIIGCHTRGGALRIAYPGLISVSLPGLKAGADMRQLSEGRRNSGRQSLPEPADRRSAPHLRCSSARVLRRRPGSHPGPARAGFNRQSAIGNRQFPEPEPELGWQGAAFVEHWNGSWHET